MSEIIKSEYNALGEDNNYKTHYFKTSADQVVGLGRMKNTEYQVGDVVYSDTNNTVALKCTTTGTTSNTELDISGNNVGESVTDGSVVWEVVKRDLTDDVEGNLQYLLDELKKYLPLIGGNMTGGVVANGEGTVPFIKRGDSISALSFYGADTYEKSALISLKGIDNHDIAGEEGGFFISATNGTTRHWLAGLKNGELLWDGSRVINGVSIQAQYVTTPNTPMYLPEGGTWVGIWVQSVSNSNYADSGIVYQAGGSWFKTTDANVSAFSLICFRVI